jgi:zinc transport system ATP-binding protein
VKKEKPKPMIQAKKVSFSFDELSVLKNISFEIEEGDFVAILGPNGAGKTTLVKLITGLLPLQAGELELGGESVRSIKDRTFIGYVPQRYSIDKLFPGTVKEILASQKSGSLTAGSEFGVGSLLSQKFVELSGGQQQRVLIALALQNQPKILILDEPTVGIDLKTEAEFFALLKSMKEKYRMTILMVTHDVGMVPTVADKVLCINHHVCCMGKASEGKELLKKAYGSYEVHHHHGSHHARVI